MRERVLRAWAESPARFREDANAEEDQALGGYRDRVVIELAQNAADAAVRAGVPGRLRLELRGGVLTAANTGAPLDAAGVEALSTLRASAKRDDAGSVGRFGVGFAAVVSVTDHPAIASVSTPEPEPATASGAADAAGVVGVGWSVEAARGLVAGIASLADELARRGGQVPLLRLPFALAGADTPGVPDGFATVVRLPLRDEAAVALVRARLGEVGPALMLALPALERVEVDVEGDVRVLTAEQGPGGRVTIGGTVWRTADAHGRTPPELLADRPVEERARPSWQVRWALPETPETSGTPGAPDAAGAEVPRVVHAPTPSDERLDLPALLIASFPLAPDRRHVAPGPLTDFLVERAAEAYERLLRDHRPVTPKLLDLVPGPVGAGELDARIRRAILGRLPETPLLPLATGHEDAVEGDGEGAAERRMRGRDAIVLDAPPAFVELLASGDDHGGAVLPGLLPPGWPARHAALGALGVRRVELADVIDELAALDREPAWWRRLYEALSGASTDSLGALPVPLAGPSADGWERGGRVVRGPRGLLIADDSLEPAALEALGLRFVHPEAVHPLLARLGAVEAGARAVLADPAVRAAVENSFDAEEPDGPEEIAEAVLGLVAAAGLDPGEEPWLADLALSAEDGDLYPAGELLLPGSPLREVMAADAPFGVVAGPLLERWGPEPLAAAGVLDGFALARGEDVNLMGVADQAESFDLDGEDRWADEILDRLGEQELPPLMPEFQAVRDLELVDDWPAALRLLAGPPWRAAITDPAHVTLYDGRRATVPSYTAWWLRRHPVLDGRLPEEFRLPGPEGDPLAGLYDPAPDGLDERLLLALGVRTSLHDLLDRPGGVAELLDRLGDPARSVTRAQLGELWTALADASETSGTPLADPRTACAPWSTARWRWWTRRTRSSWTVPTSCRCWRASRSSSPRTDGTGTSPTSSTCPSRATRCRGRWRRAGRNAPSPRSCAPSCPPRPPRTRRTTASSWTARRSRGGPATAVSTPTARTAWHAPSPGRPTAGTTA
ncbi:sacsin N-terminal ATP-binding-like domain-containing protein [Actinomadura yumaensis]|uniref:sacsin N-terminal ATP-binding-like domain-containing protein n=1 Tax=Actinomadura yumaensis TaxID=111807 RepID=UPI00361FBE9B